MSAYPRMSGAFLAAMLVLAACEREVVIEDRFPGSHVVLRGRVVRAADATAVPGGELTIKLHEVGCASAALTGEHTLKAGVGGAFEQRLTRPLVLSGEVCLRIRVTVPSSSGLQPANMIVDSVRVVAEDTPPDTVELEVRLSPWATG